MSSGNIDPIQNPQSWDTVTIGGNVSPGLAEVGECKRAHEWDVKKGKGTLGATITFVSRPPAKFSVKFKLWTVKHFQDWDQFRPLLKYNPAKKNPQPVEIYHPSLADIDVNTVVTESIGNIVHEGQQLYSITVEFLEYFRPPKKSVVSTPTGSATSASTSGAPGATQPSALDAQQQQIQALLAQAAAP